ncbi:MAG: hypothetical protein U0744_07125 [Gemmataceae bacterium]
MAVSRRGIGDDVVDRAGDVPKGVGLPLVHETADDEKVVVKKAENAAAKVGRDGEQHEADEGLASEEAASQRRSIRTFRIRWIRGQVHGAVASSSIFKSSTSLARFD